MDFMSVMSAIMNGIWDLYAKPLHFPEPIGTTSSGDILLFFASAYIIADLIGSVAERRD